MWIRLLDLGTEPGQDSFWVKVKSGRGIPPKPRLKAYNGDPRNLLKPPKAQRPRSEATELVDERLAAVVTYEQDPAHLIKVPTRVTRWHPLVAATRDAFQASYKDSRGLPLPGGKGLNIAVSSEQRARACALRIANALVRALEERGYIPWCQESITWTCRCLVYACR